MNWKKQIRRRKAYERLFTHLNKYQKILDQMGKGHIIKKESDIQVKINQEVYRVKNEIKTLEDKLGINHQKIEV